MRFRTVSAQVLEEPRSGASRRRPVRHRTGRTGPAQHAGPRRTREIVMTFTAAWAADDRATMAALTTPDVTCRWSGFEPEPIVARGLWEVLRQGRGFEDRHGIADHYGVLESMGGRRHAAVLFELDRPLPGLDRGVRIAVYRLDGGRIAAIAVYGERLD